MAFPVFLDRSIADPAAAIVAGPHRDRRRCGPPRRPEVSRPASRPPRCRRVALVARGRGSSGRLAARGDYHADRGANQPDPGHRLAGHVAAVSPWSHAGRSTAGRRGLARSTRPRAGLWPANRIGPGPPHVPHVAGRKARGDRRRCGPPRRPEVSRPPPVGPAPGGGRCAGPLHDRAMFSRAAFFSHFLPLALSHLQGRVNRRPCRGPPRRIWRGFQDAITAPRWPRLPSEPPVRSATPYPAKVGRPSPFHVRLERRFKSLPPGPHAATGDGIRRGDGPRLAGRGKTA